MMVDVEIVVKIDVAEMARVLTPTQINVIMDGLARVIAAGKPATEPAQKEPTP